MWFYLHELSKAWLGYTHALGLKLIHDIKMRMTTTMMMILFWKLLVRYLPVSFQRQLVDTPPVCLGCVDTPPVRLGSVWTRSGANCFRLGLAVVLLTRTCPQRPSREKDMTSFWRRRHVLMMAWYLTTRTHFFLRQRTLKLPDLWGFMNRQRPDSQT